MQCPLDRITDFIIGRTALCALACGRFLGVVMIRFCGFLVAALLAAQVAISQDARGLAENAINLNRYGQTLEGPARQNVLMDVRRILDRVIVEYPNSAEAAAIRAGGFVGELNVAGLNAELSGRPMAVAPPALNLDGGSGGGLLSGTNRPQSNGAPVPPMPFDPKARMKSVQETLNARGCKTGNPDGVSGRRTLRGYQAFLKEKGLSESLYPIDSEQFWQALMASEGEVCEIVIVPVTAKTMLGNWSYTSRCGRNSRMPGQKVNGVLSIRASGGNRFRGQLINSQGLRANLSGQTTGRRVTFTANFGFLFGKVTGRGTIADEAYVVHGRDSHGCSFTARKR